LCEFRQCESEIQRLLCDADVYHPAVRVRPVADGLTRTAALDPLLTVANVSFMGDPKETVANDRFTERIVED
jgi:hypothetical protein